MFRIVPVVLWGKVFFVPVPVEQPKSPWINAIWAFLGLLILVILVITITNGLSNGG